MKLVIPHLLLFLTLTAAAFAQSNATCMDCHNDPSLTMERLTGTVSLIVTPDSLKGSPHAGMNCVDCHSSLKGVEDFPHKSVKGVNCANAIRPRSSSTWRASSTNCRKWDTAAFPPLPIATACTA